jgi:hypothetical protein
MLNDREVSQFIEEGFVRIENAFSRELAVTVVNILWNDIPFDRWDPVTWTEPVVRLGMYHQQPFVDSVNTPKLHAAYDQLIGANRWIPCRLVGTFPVRFPSTKKPNDTGKHIDASFPAEEPDNYFKWRVNIKSRGRALLMLVLYSDIGDNDAPTLIDKGSHWDVAKLLSSEGDAGLSFIELADKLKTLPRREEVVAVGKAGTVYLCHPFLVHGAQAHHGTVPKFMAQPPLLPKGDFFTDVSMHPLAPVEWAIQRVLASMGEQTN